MYIKYVMFGEHLNIVLLCAVFAPCVGIPFLFGLKINKHVHNKQMIT